MVSFWRARTITSSFSDMYMLASTLKLYNKFIQICLFNVKIRMRLLIFIFYR